MKYSYTRIDDSSGSEDGGELKEGGARCRPQIRHLHNNLKNSNLGSNIVAKPRVKFLNA
jgi:hypothetical protein